MTAELIQICTLPAINGYDILKRVYSADGVAPTISTCGGGNTEPKVLIEGARE